jgi:hypothetical protein
MRRTLGKLRANVDTISRARVATSASSSCEPKSVTQAAAHLFLECAQRDIERMADEEVDAGVVRFGRAKVSGKERRAQAVDDLHERRARRTQPSFGFAVMPRALTAARVVKRRHQLRQVPGGFTRFGFRFVGLRLGRSRRLSIDRERFLFEPHVGAEWHTSSVAAARGVTTEARLVPDSTRAG